MTAILAVGSSAVLGCLIVIYICFFASCFVALVVFGTIIQEHDADLNERETCQHNGKNIKSDGELDELVGLPLQSPARNLGELTGRDGNLGLLDGNQSRSRDYRCLSGKAVNLLFRASYPILKLIGCHKIKTVAKQPNDQKLSHGGETKP